MLAPALSPNPHSVPGITGTRRHAGRETRHRFLLPTIGSLAATLRFAAAALLLPQLPTLIWCLQTRSFIYLRGWINIEYLVVLALAIAFPGWGTLLLATLEMCLALVEPLAHLYFFKLGDVLASLRYVIFLPFPRLLEDSCLLFAYAAVTWFALRFCLGVHHQHHRVRHRLYFLAALLLLASAADVGQGRFARFLHCGPSRGDADVESSRIIRMPIASLVFTLLHAPGEGSSSSQSPLPLASVLSQAMAEVSPSHPDVVLVLTESWGLAADASITTLQTEAYRSSALSSLYRIQTGHTPFSGSTTSGETRELCGNDAGHASLSYAESYFAQCWPARLKHEGYVTRAVHGFAPTMFRRGEWYRRFGFDEETFVSDLQRAGAATCDGAFPGICDNDAAHWIGSSLLETRNQRPQFVHWVTLNSHLPVAGLDQESPDRDCVATGIEHEQSLCSWSVLVRRVHESVARLAATPGLRPTVFVIVGDHAPPFMRTDLRNRFSQTDVPYVVLVPRSPPEGAPNTAALTPLHR